ncbi:DUF4350 domain-containing protein [Asanoa sp. WMMD1127]|uniref:DUF4350 domain-containing protein n=1 Tax=Asanoa sp. WMMD1127 TaxID=3016107 RepID=UPI0024173BA6|nr:DUF4350 domain-containing protein [Asanoa sp. WMMD1127]MDG4820910.1 DUF4350 domain-containing protein [Asanoa sp. WMMD1127]
MTVRAPGRRAALLRGLRRTRRTTIPFGLALLVVLTTVVAHAIDTPDTGDADFLSPVSEAGIGSARLADAVRERGVTVVRHTDPRTALTDSAGATLFVPAAEFLDAQTAEMLESLPADTRIVLVDPPARTLQGAGVPLTRAQRRWATRAEPSGGCRIPGVEQTGDVAARRQAYAVNRSRAFDACYRASVFRFSYPQEIVVVGATDPFRNDRLAEHDNRAFAAGLLATRPRLVWLDLHERYTPPEPPPGTGPPDDYRTDDGQPVDPGEGYPAPPEGDRSGARDGDGSSDDGESAAGGDSASLTDAFPPWVWAMLATLGAALLLLLLWAARRLGPAVSEPLPVEVRSGETVLGRGRLYQRAKARGPAAEVLRRAALRRIEPALGLEPGHTPTDVAEAVAARTGRDPDRLGALLYGPEPTHDDELLDLARGLDTVADEVGGVPSRDTQPGGAGPDTPPGHAWPGTQPGGAGPDQGEPR